MHGNLTSSSLLEVVERDAWLDLFAAAPRDVGRKLGISSGLFSGMGLLGTHELAMVEFNRAMCVGVEAPVTATSLEQASAWLEINAALGWALQIAPSAETPAVHDWLYRRTMTPSGRGWAKFARKASHEDHICTSTIRVRPVDAASASAFGQVVQAGFDLPVATAEWFAALFGRSGWHLYLAYDGETPIASGAAFVRHGVAWFGIDATLTDYRRRGAQTALINRRIEDGCRAMLAQFTAETGQPTAGQEAVQTSYSNYRRAGFTPVYVRPNYRRA
jgi:hypothetical protein